MSRFWMFRCLCSTALRPPNVCGSTVPKSRFWRSRLTATRPTSANFWRRARRATSSKKAASQELATAIRVVAAGGVHLDPQIAGQVVEGFVNPTGTEGDGGMSAREIEILMLVAYGHTNKEIAAKLHLAVKTVEGHKTRINEKLKLRTRAELVRFALRRGWLRDE